MSTKVLFWVQHLLGIGHVKRASPLTRAMMGQGFDVTVAMGGFPVRHVDWGGAKVAQLPAVQAKDESFKPLYDETDAPIDETWKEKRAAALMALYEAEKPDVFLLELFPFGRRQFRFELLPVLERARADGCKVVTSVRDILVKKSKEERNLEMLELARSWLDAVLVHGDPDVIPFEETFPHGREIKDLIHYTGYVVDKAFEADPSDSGKNEVIVSVGSGAVGEPLLNCIPEAPGLSQHLADKTWRVLIGDSLPAEIASRLRARAPAGMIVESNRSDFPVLLKNCAVSISLGGYNTTMDVLQSGARAVIAPFATLEESEQLYRTEWLAKSGHVEMVSPQALSSASIAAAADRAFTKRSSATGRIDFDGSEKTARILSKITSS